MNRERLLFVGVLAIVGLWFVLRAPEKPATPPTPRGDEVVRLPILPASYSPVVLGEHAGKGVFTQPSNVRPHPRPVDVLEKPKDFDLPNIWPPTSRSVSIDNLDHLRRDAAAPQTAAAQVTLPKAVAGVAGGVAAEERVDTWMSKGAAQRGQVNTITAGGANLKSPPQPWPYGAAVLKPAAGPDLWKFLRALVLLPDPDRAQDEGVREVVAISAQKMTFRQAYPEDISGFQIAVAGKQQGYLRGLKDYLDVRRNEAYEPRVRAGQALLAQGLGASKDHREGFLNWSLVLFSEARERVPDGAEDVRRTILLSMLRAAGALNDHDLVLSLAIDHLFHFPQSPEVLEHVGNVLASRSFSLAPFAIEFFARAGNQASAQRRMIEELVREGRFEEAAAEIAAGRAGAAGPEQDLLRARVALARGDFKNATAVADRHDDAGGAIGAEALQLLGAIAYATGDAAAAAQRFEQAATADPSRSTAFSDWGLALAAEGKTEDALLCFAQALELDAIDNAVAPQIGRGYLKLAAGEARLRAAADAEEAGRKEPKIAAEKAEEAQRLRGAAKEDFAAAAELLLKLQDDNRSDLEVRYMLGYAKERTGNLKEAADLYRATIDGDSRYRVAIARLGVVQSQLALEGRDPKDAAAAIAHLSKAVELSPQEAILPYVLARFLMNIERDHAGEPRRAELALADRMFAKAVKLPVSERNGNLPLWAELGQACLAYADEAKESLDAKRLLNSLLERIKDKMPTGTVPAKLFENEVYRAAQINLQIVEENERKSDRIWDFFESSTKFTDWKYDFKSPMEIRTELGKGLVFHGTINYEGGARTAKSVLEYCAVKLLSKDLLNGGSFWELEVTGVVPKAVGDQEPAELGIGLIQPPRGDQVLGVQVKRKRTGNLEVRLDGGDRQVFKNVKADWVPLKDVLWPEGEFRLKIEVVPEYGLGKRRAQGRFRLLLNGEEVFRKEFKDAPGERAAIFAPSKASQVLELYLWVEGRDGAEVKEIQVKTVTLTVESVK